MSLNPLAVTFVPRLAVADGCGEQDKRADRTERVAKRAPRPLRQQRPKPSRVPKEEHTAVFKIEETHILQPRSPYLEALSKTAEFLAPEASVGTVEPRIASPPQMPAIQPIQMRPSASAIEKNKFRWMDLARMASKSSCAGPPSAVTATSDHKCPAFASKAEAWHSVLSNTSWKHDPTVDDDKSDSEDEAIGGKFSCPMAKPTIVEWWRAVWNNDHVLMLSCLQRGANWDVRWVADKTVMAAVPGAEVAADCIGLCALHIFARRAQPMCLEYLLSIHAVQKSIDLRDRAQKRTALHFACDLGHAECAALLLRHGSDVNAKDKNAETPLHLAVPHVQLTQFVSTMLTQGARVNSRNKRGLTPLMLGRSRRVVQAMLEVGGDALQKDGSGWTALCHFCAHGALGALSAALCLPEVVSSLQADGQLCSTTPLHQAALHGQLPCAQLLLSKFSNLVDLVDRPLLYTPLLCAAGAGHSDVFLALVEAGAALEYVAPDGMSALALAGAKHHLQLVWSAAVLARSRAGRSGFAVTNDRGLNPLATVAQLLRQKEVGAAAADADACLPLLAALLVGGAALDKHSLRLLASPAALRPLYKLGMVADARERHGWSLLQQATHAENWTADALFPRMRTSLCLPPLDSRGQQAAELLLSGAGWDLVLTNCADLSAEAASSSCLGSFSERLRCGVVCAHQRVVLAACPMLAGMHRFNQAQGRTQGPTVLHVCASSEALAYLAAYLYCGRLVDPRTDALSSLLGITSTDSHTMSDLLLELARLGQEMLVSGLTDRACELAAGCLNRGNAAGVLHQAQQCGFADLEIATVFYILQLVSATREPIEEVLWLEANNADEVRDQAISLVASLLEVLKQS